MHHVNVKKCDVTQCCFNKTNICHAMAVQIGDEKPACDTYSPSDKHQCGINGVEADVGACKVSTCQYNQNFLCDASSIAVGWKEGLPECLTFKHR